MIDRKDWARYSVLLDEALELDATNRQRWLEALRLRDPEAALVLSKMLPRLESTNASSAPITAFADLLTRAFDEVSATESASPGQSFGPWQVSHKLGSGGMGEVWMAQRADALYEGQAAIKLLLGGADAKRLSARFTRERNLLARLTHPGIARLLDAGISGDQPYLVLEYVDGQSLLEYAHQHAPTVAARLRLALSIGRAVEHAHGHLIIHRDLKPSNVMVSAEGEVKLLDFGIAALMDDAAEDTTPLTRLYGRGLTLDYAAPEQITGAPTGVACDVFSLGAMLFELLAGTRPFQGRQPGRAALEHAVLHQDAPRLSRAIAAPLAAAAPAGARPQDARRIHGDLDAVIAKALRKMPEDRYPTMAAFIADLENWLAHRPVSARHGDWRYRSSLWLRRNRTVAALSALVAFSLVAGLSFSLWQLQRALKAEAQAKFSALEAKRQAESAELRKEFAFGLLSAGDVAATGPSAATDLSLKMLDLAASRIDTSFGDKPLLRAQIKSEISTIYHNRGLYQRAVSLRQDALKLYQQANADRSAQIQAWLQLGEAQQYLGDDISAEKSLRAAVALGPLRPGEVDIPDENAQAWALVMLGFFLKESGRFDEARPLLERAALLYRQSMGTENHPYLRAQNYLSQLYRATERYEDALSLARESLRLHETGKIGQPNDVALDLVLEGRIFLALGRFGEAIKTFDHSYDVFLHTLGPAHPHSHYLLTFRGEAHMANGEYKEAEPLLRESLRLRLAEPEGSPLAFNTRWRLAMNAMYRGDLAEAESQARLHLEALLKSEGSENALVGQGREVLGEVLMARGNLKEAEEQLQRAVAIAEKELPAPSMARGRSEMLLATVLSLQGRHEEALRVVASAVDNLRKKMDENHFLTVKALCAQGQTQWRAGQASAALLTLNNALSRGRIAFRKGHPELANILAAQAEVLIALRRQKEALPLLQEAHTILVNTPEVDPERLRAISQLLANV